VSALLIPLTDVLRSHVFAADVVHADDTPIPVRKGEHPQRHLEHFSGVLQADGYAGYSKLYDGGRVLEAACWAHVRRKFVDLHELHKSPLAAQMLDRIGALYGIECDIVCRQDGVQQTLTHFQQASYFLMGYRAVTSTSTGLPHKDAPLPSFFPRTVAGGAHGAAAIGGDRISFKHRQESGS